MARERNATSAARLPLRPPSSRARATLGERSASISASRNRATTVGRSTSRSNVAPNRVSAYSSAGRSSTSGQASAKRIRAARSSIIAARMPCLLPKRA
jgi:hypothetical protein